MSIGIAFRAFFAALFDKRFAEQARVILASTPSMEPSLPKESPASPKRSKPTAGQRSDALTLMSALQREARFLDLVQEPLDGYTDAQIGAAARHVLRDTGKTLNRFFAIRRLVDTPEGQKIELPAERPATRWRIVGPNPNGTRATLIHAGWQATQCNIPQWTGLPEDSMVFAPAEVEA